MIDYFDGTEYDFLSNFHPDCHVIFDGIEYATTEHAYQAAKSLKDTDRAKIAAMKGDEAGLAKWYGRQVIKLRADWEEIKDDIMLDLLRQKFSRPDLRAQLVATAPHDLKEGNHWHDNYWGDCICTTRSACRAPGKNMLGMLLMQVRAEIMSEGE